MKPVFDISINGKSKTDLFREYLSSIVVTDQAGIDSDSVAIELADPENKLIVPEKGESLSVSLGYEETGLKKLGEFFIDDANYHWPPMMLGISAIAANLKKSIKEPKSRSFENVTIGALCETIAGEHGLTAKVSDEYKNINIPYLAQTEESDIHLLTRIAFDQGAIAKVASTNLVFVTRAQAKTVSGKNLTPIQITGPEILQGNFQIPERNKYNSVICVYHDQATGQPIEVEAGSGKPSFRLRKPQPTLEQALASARARLSALQRSSARLSLTVVGNTQLRAEMPVIVSGVRPRVNGEWVTEKAVHTFSTNGYITSLELTPKV